MTNKWLLLSALCLTTGLLARAQYTVDKVIGARNEALIDSLKQVKYPYVFPIWGQKVVSKGFELPYPAGLSAQYVWQKSDIVVQNLRVGFNNGPMYDLDDLIRIDKATAETSGMNIRPDFWLFPFLNVYGLFAKSQSSTTINAGLWIPDSTNTWKKAADFSTKASFNGTTVGFGLTPTFGIGGYFMAIDMNFSWTDIEQLAKPAYVFVLGPRFGKNFKFAEERSLADWIGGFRVHMNSSTSGSLALGDLFDTKQWQNKIDSGSMKVANAQGQVDAWWAGLTPVEQKNPVNIAKHETADAVLTRAGQFLNSASQVIGGVDQSTVQYSLEKAPKDKWNFLIGSQFQINKHFMLRAEYGFLGTRQQFIGGFQWRFGL
jgi:hypothetical protein